MAQNLGTNEKDDILVYHLEPELVGNETVITEILPIRDTASSVAVMMYLTETKTYAVSIVRIFPNNTNPQFMFLKMFES